MQIRPAVVPVAEKYFELAKGVGVAIFGVAIMAIILSFVAPFLVGAVGGEIAEKPSTSSWIDTGVNERPDNLDVSATREQAVQLDGEGYVEAPEPPLNDSWTTCSVGALTEGVNQRAHYTLLAIDNETVTLRFADGNWTARYIPDNGSETAASAAASSPTDLTAVCGRYDNTTNTLDLVVDGTVAASSADGQVDQTRQPSVAWNGTVDETRVWGRALSDSDLAAYGDDPVTALPGTDRQLRVMFDEDLGGETRAHSANGRAGLIGTATIGSPGVPRPGISEGADWEARNDGSFQIRAVEGGYLDSAPIVFVAWPGGPFGSIVSTLFNVGPAALSLLVVAVLVMAANILLREFEGGGF
jgi:hypothetical protein